MKTRVLVLHPDPSVLQTAARLLEAEGLEVEAARGLQPSPGPVAAIGPDAILVGGPLDEPGEDANFRRIRALFPEAALLVLAPHDRAEATFARLGAQIDDLVAEPVERSRLLVSLRNALARRRLERRVEALVAGLESSAGMDSLVVRSDAMRRAVELLRRAALRDDPLLLHGAAGRDSELAARAVHAEGPRAGAPWVFLDLASLPPHRIGAELFGEKSAAGALRQAERGTVYLASIEHLPRDVQGLLHAAVEGPADVRLIASTRLAPEALRGALEGPLGALLCAQAVRLPALNERVGDLPGLAWSALRRLGHRHGVKLAGLTPAAVEALEAHDWTGDVGELEGILERALLVEEGPRLDVHSLPASLRNPVDSGAAGTGLLDALAAARANASGANGAPEPVQANGSAVPLLPPGTVLPFHELERRILLHALRTTGWNVQEAARRLKLGRATIYRKIERYGLKREAG